MSVDDYFDFALQVIKSNLNPDRGYLHVARLGVLLRNSNPGVTWQKFGFSTLASFLGVLSERRQIDVIETEKGALAVKLPEGDFRLQPPQSPPAYNPLRKPVWVAFVLEEPGGRRFLHRVSGRVLLSIQQAPAPVDEWVEITPVSSDEQRAWAREFLATKQIEREDAARALAADEWYKEFPRVLRELDPPLLREWNQIRSSKISELVSSWCAANAISTALVFQFEPRVPRVPVVRTRLPVERVATRPTDDVRKIVLEALSQLPTEALLEIPIPAKYLLPAIRNVRPSVT